MIELSATAKINLNLRILGKRKDGFHDLETLMTCVDLADTLTVSKAGTLRFTCSRPDLETEDNLVIRAVRLLEKEVTSDLPVSIHLEKRTPSGAGLGGGSSDAAATFKAVRELYQLDVSNQRLEALAADLGSDIPFFITEGTAWCRGRGERLEPIEFPWKLNLMLLRHPLEIPTPWAYKHWASSKEIPGLPYTTQTMPWGEIINDLERPAFAKYLILGDTKRWLLDQPEVEAAAMTGSGSALFAILKDGVDRQELAKRAKEHYGESLWTY
ncbi:4-(cytidine 5'-diphospho)-2-C-methyl-D-erythritol kinase [Verrucomicrobiales bacterium]|jgi:4-diphosphocytidyl-2-C-methyl-D-erythritol kinase|nr:4-(cytidine 5'-diphospho)-2-C-methyl-D-erythritol kinase [Verrucomicrobiales bacterium]MDB2347386.1 4-(cytidine 5'-diphospho)-2-C-methyl-D-erythritol kinase [Verrucomicrobiales bacterium]MDB4468063.1 4-(cytidine 5'-diphospho)-2-C-methyl-D-erythritol kinase [Verrucomicrobiales bacterium]MDB4789642.1 4-(cytidine 5'-diphospho)-2-C-methyl-D-erythritol kinase [Verrucomicrobiales bacterium]MDC0503282.1 4-(cytidine 5'-diphospho)-2-C-methyl-D-erythritol kinase [Verrucomicrobiales bacterium]